MYHFLHTTIDQHRVFAFLKRADEDVAIRRSRSREDVAGIDTKLAKGFGQLSNMCKVYTEHQGGLAARCNEGLLQSWYMRKKSEKRLHARSSHVLTTNSFTVSVLITWARLVALKSPVLELTVTSLRSILARTEVKRTLHSLNVALNQNFRDSQACR